MRKKQGKTQGGNAVVETAFMLPWLVFLFVGVLDFGFYSYAAICTQNAARAVALAGSNLSPSSTLTAARTCEIALQEMKGLPNVYSVTTCAAVDSGITDAVPVAACFVRLTDTAAVGGAANCNSTFACADCVENTAARSSLAVVSYRTMPMIPIPGALTGRLTLTRFAEMRGIQ